MKSVGITILAVIVFYGFIFTSLGERFKLTPPNKNNLKKSRRGEKSKKNSSHMKNTNSYNAMAAHRKIAVDGKFEDWGTITFQEAKTREHLFIWKKELTGKNWHGPQDLSFRWRAAWQKNQLFFQIEVIDDILAEPKQERSFKNDCLEIFIDPFHTGGNKTRKKDSPIGYELHFTPWNPTAAWYGKNKFKRENPPTKDFQKTFSSSHVMRKTKRGYVLELALSLPNLKLEKGQIIGIDVVVCDDDGQGREKQITWTATKMPFWRVMDDYGKLILGE